MRKIEVPSYTPPKVGAFIKHLRKKFFLTQNEICNKIGISRPTLNKIEADKAEITLLQAKKLADHFNISLSDLLAAEDTANTNIRSALIASPVKNKIPLDSEAGLAKAQQVIIHIWKEFLGSPEFVDKHVHLLLFQMDYNYLQQHHCGIFGLRYTKKQDSPIVNKYNLLVSSLVENNCLEKINSKKYDYPNIKFLNLCNPNFSNFSAEELIIIEQVVLTAKSQGLEYVSRMIKILEPLKNTKEEGEISLYPQ